MQGKEKLFDFDRIRSHYHRILITDGRNVLTTEMQNFSGFLPTQKFPFNLQLYNQYCTEQHKISLSLLFPTLLQVTSHVANYKV